MSRTISPSTSTTTSTPPAKLKLPQIGKSTSSSPENRMNKEQEEEKTQQQPSHASSPSQSKSGSAGGNGTTIKPVKTKVALTPAEKRAAKLRQEQAKEEAAATSALKAKILASKRAARKSSNDNSVRSSLRGSIDGSSGAVGSGSQSGRESSEGLRTAGGGENDGSATPVSNRRRRTNDSSSIAADNNDDLDQPAQPDDDPNIDTQEDIDAATEEANKLLSQSNEENFDIVFDGPKSELITATAAHNYHDILRLIQEVPFDMRLEYINAYDEHGCSAIFFALSNEHYDCLQLLLDYGSDVNHQNNKKNTPLHIACALQNKRSIRLLIEHGANIQSENWQYQKPHEMISERDKVSSTQAYLNSCLEQYNEKLESKVLFAGVTRQQRCYYRSLYDITDVSQLGVLRYDMIEKLVQGMGVNGSENVPRVGGGMNTGATASDESSPSSTSATASSSAKHDSRYLFNFFKSWDTDRNGVLSFSEFLHRILTALNERERLKKKAKRRALMQAKRKKKKEAEAAKKANSIATAKALERPLELSDGEMY